MLNHVEIRARFARLAEGVGLQAHRQEILNSAWFPGEFNRCMEHGGINRRLQGDRNAQPSRWFSVAPAVRTKDFALAPKGTHCTAFEALCTLAYIDAADASDERFAQSAAFIAFVEELGFDRTELSISLFGGGDFLGREFPRDDEWYEIWRKLGVPTERLSWVPGPKLYMLFLADRERCGPRCEVALTPVGASNGELLEIGTLIWDRELVSPDPLGWKFEQPAENAVGMALGLQPRQNSKHNR